MSVATLPRPTAAPRPRSLPAGAGILPAPAAPPTLDIVVPVYNEERDLEPSVRRLHRYLRERFPFPARITIADNASTDATWEIAERLARDLDGVRALRLERKGRGRALRAAWLASDAPIVAYMDVDLSTDLDALLPLVAPLLSGHSALAIGSRLAPGARVVRGPKRELISRCYNALLRAVLRARFRDAQCGFKALRAETARALLPLVEDDAWFFDTELLVLAQRAGLRLHEVPVDWTDDPDSRVRIIATALADLRGVWRLLRRGPSTKALATVPGRRAMPDGGPVGRQLASFAGIGVASTLAYVGLYSILRLGLPAGAANALALLATAVANTAANRRFTFGVRGPDGAVRDQVGGLAALGLALAITTAALGGLDLADPHPGRGLELAVLVVANLLATIARFVLLRAWITAPRAWPARLTERNA